MIEQLQDIEKSRQEMKRQAFECYFKNTEIYNRECHLRKADILETWSKHLGCYSNIIAHESLLMWQAAQEQMLQAIHSDMKDTYYWDGAEYVVDWVNEYEMDLERGEIAELEKWKRTKEVKVYVAAIYSNEDDFELVEFDSEEKAKKAAQENLLMLDAFEKKPIRHHLL